MEKMYKTCEGIKEGHEAERRKEILREDPHLQDRWQSELLFRVVQSQNH